MCGITGFWQFNHEIQSMEQTVEKMASAIRERGPDSEGNWVDPAAGIAFGHRRLSIVDLSPAGHQPMISASGRYVISYNGEIYNAGEIRHELHHLQIPFRGFSDTEVILEACEHWGIEKAVSKFIGMFAFSLWDRQTRTLYLVRDRLGIKPLYWGFQQGTLLFGSQPKSLWAHPSWVGDINRDAVTAFIYLNYVPAPLSIFDGIYHLEPGYILKITSPAHMEKIPYWRLENVVANGLQNKITASSREIQQELKSLLQDAVKRRMVADVPLGAFLSGGIDSSLVVAMMQENHNVPIKTFSIGFQEEGYNEAPYAKAVASHLKTDHHELYLSPQEALDVIPSIPEWCDEPFADVSQIPTYLVSKLARQHVTVSLSGDGGDEGFAGYNRYLFGVKFSKMVEKTPSLLRKIAARGIEAIPPSLWDKGNYLLPSSLRQPALGDKIHKASHLLTANSPMEIYYSLLTFWPDPESIVHKGKLPTVFPDLPTCLQGADHIVAQRQFCDFKSYLPHDILTKVDRASMHTSLESRVPLLDHRVIEYAWRLPAEMKIQGGKGKWILRQILNEYVPTALFERPKQGFGVPIDTWLRGSLKDWAAGYLDPTRLSQEGFLNSAPIEKRWQEHQAGSRNWQYSLWGVLMFQTWLEKYRNR